LVPVRAAIMILFTHESGRLVAYVTAVVQRIL
jgi:hypothetical protein